MSLLPLYQQVEHQEWIDIPSGWLQGRTVFGGLVAGLLAQKALNVVNDAAKQLLSCNITFVGPVQEGQAKLTAEVLRQGKSVTTLEVRLWQADAVQSILIASFGAQRESRIHVQNLPQVPHYPQPEQLDKTAYIEGLMPQCLQQFELCWAEGSYPMAGSKLPDFGGWSRVITYFKKKKDKKISQKFSLIEVPSRSVGRFVLLPSKPGSTTVMLLEDVIEFNLPIIFSHFKFNQFEAHVFKITKDAELDLDQEVGINFIEIPERII